ncbi:MAG TPA: bacteriohemerythrin [bacterium]|nr:bacteriohemerythrin [bacterium]
MFKKIIWSTKYSVGVQEIDNQHKQFFKICNDLIKLSENKKFSEDLALVSIMRLGDYAFYHLGTEEELFFQTKYTEAANHIKIHNSFRKSVKEFIKLARDKKTDKRKNARDVAIFMSAWLASHILTVDKKYSDYFNKKGIK